MAAIAPVLLALLLTGLTGGLGHCLGMCGPLVLLAGGRFPRQGLASTPYHLLYHGGRIGVYTILGLAAGGVGALAGKISRLAHIPAIVSLLLGAAVIIAGIVYLGWLRLPPAQRLGRWWRAAVDRVLHLPRLWGVLLLGMLNGLLPCGLVYSALLLSAAAGSPIFGALGMLIFGLGTLPVLIAFGVGAGMAALPLRQTLARISGLFVMLVGMQLMLRGAAALSVVSHLMMGKVMIW